VEDVIMRLLKLMFLGAILTAFVATAGFGKAEYTKKEGKPCATCHTKTGSKELNDTGKCYAKDKSLKDCKLPEKK
jgi:hypothetical protein